MPNQWTKNPVPALERFARKCAFDPLTGCVMWISGQTSGHGHNQPYGAFWFEGSHWLAHRWAAIHIHGLEITGLQVDHCCPAGPSTLCVQHVKPEPADVNRALQHLRPGRTIQQLATKQYLLLVERGYEEYKAPERIPGDVPFFTPPDWLRPFLPAKEFENACPF